jgi:hypothetical protein
VIARARGLVPAIAAPLGLACCGPTLDPSVFVPEDAPFEGVPAEVLLLDGDVLGPLLSEVNLRFRLYQALRTALPIDELNEEVECLSNVAESDSELFFSLDVPCRYDDGQGGTVDVHLAQTGSSPTVFTTDIAYHDVARGLLSVDGTEVLVDIVSVTAEVHLDVDLDLVQDGFDLDYGFTFRLDAEGTPFFDYVMEIPDGEVLVVLTNATTPGAFASALVVGLDGTLVCEIRDTAWEPGEDAKGTCENGASFGLEPPPL